MPEDQDRPDNAAEATNEIAEGPIERFWNDESAGR